MKRQNYLLRPAIGLCALALAVAIGLLFGTLPVNRTKLDLSQNHISTPSDALLTTVRSIGQPVTIYAFEDESANGWLTDLSHRGAAESSYMTVKSGTTQLKSAYGLPDTVNGGSLLIVSDKRHYFLDNAAAFTYNYAYDYTTGGYAVASASYHGDSALTDALNYVTRDDMPVAYFVTGHGESLDGTFFTDALTRANVELKTVNLAADGGVPENCDVLILYSPVTDIGSEEKAMLLTYLESGGKLILMTNLLNGELPNLFSVAATMGLSAKMGVVLENQSDYYLTYSGEAYQQYLRPRVLGETLIDSSTQIIMPLSHGLTLEENPRESLVITELISSSDAAYVKQNANQIATFDPEENDELGRFTLAAMARENDAAIIWFGSVSWMGSEAESIIGPGNRALLTALLDDLVSLPAAGETVEIPLTVDALEVSDTVGVLYAALCFALPIAALIILLYAHARKKKRVYA